MSLKNNLAGQHRQNPPTHMEELLIVFSVLLVLLIMISTFGGAATVSPAPAPRAAPAPLLPAAKPRAYPAAAAPAPAAAVPAERFSGEALAEDAAQDYAAQDYAAEEQQPEMFAQEEELETAEDAGHEAFAEVGEEAAEEEVVSGYPGRAYAPSFL